MHPLEIYLTEIATLRGATKETSGYPALANLLNAIGHTLKPKVKCVIHPKNQGAGIPDGGLFTPDQLKKYDETEDFGDLVPARGVIETKSAGEDIASFADSEQVGKYLARYGQVLLTNYREFLLLKRVGGKTQKLEGFQLAKSEKEFWPVAAQPRKAATELGERLTEYLKRVMLHNAPLNNPKDVAFFLASYARDARSRVEATKDLPQLNAVRTALEEALGMKFEAEKGEHFFRSTLVQTLFYGVFSAWVLWHKQQGSGTGVSPVSSSDRTGKMPVPLFDWRMASWTLHVPMIKALFEQVATPTKLGPLGLVEVLDWTAAALNRVDRAAFFEKFLETHAVQYFYEPFLEAFDPELRKQLGVWYTPPEIVQYQVARVDAALRVELGISGGLADERVFVLDPCCGTGAYLVEVLRRIHHNLKEDQGLGALAELYTKKAAQERVFGFELMPAPFVVAHLQMGLLLQSLAVPLDDAKERAAIYLTNSLTGWEPPTEEAKKQLTFAIPEFKQEKEAADAIKQEKKIIVILGNPPYNGFAGLAVEEERDLTNAYRTTKRAPAPQGQGLNDLYVRFFRMAERRIVEKSGVGIISFISNYSWLDGLSFTGMRERYLEVFDSITVDCLNGDKFKTGKQTPEGKPDPSVFSTESNREGIGIGTAIATLVRSSRREEAQTSKKKSKSLLTSAATGEISFRHLWGKDKRAELLESLGQPDKTIYKKLKPPLALGLSFMPGAVSSDYLSWPLLPNLFFENSPGVKTSRDLDLIEIDLPKLKSRMENYFDEELENNEVRRMAPSLMKSAGRFDAVATRKALLKYGLKSGYFIRLAYRPFDARHLYWHPETKLLDEKREDLFGAYRAGNLFLTSRQKAERSTEGTPFYATPHLPDWHLTRPGSACFPIFIRGFGVEVVQEKKSKQGDFLHEMAAGHDTGGQAKQLANLSPNARSYLAEIGVKKPDANEPVAGLIWMHTLAVGHSPTYLKENLDALRQDWPRVPLPKSREALLASAELGRQVAALLDMEAPVDGVTKGKPRPELKEIGELNSSGETNLKITAGWGHAGQNGVTMPGKGKLETRGYTADEAAAFAPVAADVRRRTEAEPSPEVRLLTSSATLLGQSTHDIFLNESACWRNVPERVWDYTIGGYQVMKKWLSYREFDLLGRALTPDEAREVTHMARRIAALILLQPELDKNYQFVKAATYDWKP